MNRGGAVFIILNILYLSGIKWGRP